MTTTDNESIEHVNRLNSISKLKAEGFEGSDASMSESIFEYGFAWKDLGDEWLIIHRASHGKGFDRYTIAKSTNPEREWNWVKWEDISSFTGQPVTELLAFPLPELISTLISYYGVEEICGTTYWEGFQISPE